MLCAALSEMMVVKGISASLMCVVTTVSIDWPLPVFCLPWSIAALCEKSEGQFCQRVAGPDSKCQWGFHAESKIKREEYAMDFELINFLLCIIVV